jgi:hypothetical protein
MTKAQTAERQKAIEDLRSYIKPGDTVFTILDSVSRSGMSRQIRVVVPYVRHQALIEGHWEDRTLEQLASIHGPTERPETREIVDHLHPNYSVALAIGAKQAMRNGRRQDAIVIGGCGMDMGFHLVYELSHVLYASGYACLGKGACPSNYHVNHRDHLCCEGTRVYDPDGPDTGRVCWKPDYWYRHHVTEGTIPADWPRGEAIPIGEDETIPGSLLTVVSDEGEPYIVCPRCQGVGTVPNPEGPERFDLVHTDGYALRHRWL